MVLLALLRILSVVSIVILFVYSLFLRVGRRRNVVLMWRFLAGRVVRKTAEV